MVVLVTQTAGRKDIFLPRKKNEAFVSAEAGVAIVVVLIVLSFAKDDSPSMRSKFFVDFGRGTRDNLLMKTDFSKINTLGVVVYNKLRKSFSEAPKHV